MCHSYYDDVILYHAIDDAKWKSSEEKIPVSNVTLGKTFQIFSDLGQCPIKFGIKVVRDIDTAFGVSIQGFRVINFSG
ncbi:MAG: hypothetical protein P8J37_08400 [Fuerstiella sp.]|nr:hypothetical protein [Fuerstiella sp.]